MAEDETEEASKLPPDARLESLDRRLDEVQRREAAKAARAQGDSSYRTGWLVIGQLTGGPLGGGVVGWVLDRWFGTAPWLMLSLLFLGFAGGVFNVFRISGKPTGINRPGGNKGL